MKELLKKIVVITIVAVLSVGLFTGCKKKKKGQGVIGTPEGKIELVVAVSGLDVAEGELMRKWKVAYEAKNPQVQINIKNFTSDYTQTMLTYVQSPTQMPDIMWTTGEKHSPWSSEGVFVNLKTIDPSLDVSDFYDEIVKATHINSQDNGIWFMPRDYNKCVLFINKVMFKAAGFTDEEIDGLKDGWDYEKFLETCERLRVAMKNNVNPSLGLRPNSVPVDARMDFNASYCSFVKHFGGEFVEGDKVNLLSSRNLNAYGEIFELIEKGYIADSAKKSSATFNTLSAAMKIDVRPGLPTTPTTGNYDIDFLPLPLDYVGVGCSGYAITTIAQQRTSASNYNKGQKTNDYYAYEFLKFIVSEEGQRIGAETGSIIPVRESMAGDSSWLSYKSASLNHAAFISAPENDFSLNIFQDFSANDASLILDSLSGAMAQVIIASNYPAGYKANGYSKLKSAIQPYQNTVSSLRAIY